MGSMLDRIADQEREEFAAKRAIFEENARTQITREMNEMFFDDLFWFWSNRKKILALRKIIEMIGHW